MDRSSWRCARTGVREEEVVRGPGVIAALGVLLRMASLEDASRGVWLSAEGSLTGEFRSVAQPPEAGRQKYGRLLGGVVLLVPVWHVPGIPGA